MLRFSVTPEVNAASTMLIVVTVVLMIVMMVHAEQDAEEDEGMSAMDQASAKSSQAPPSSPIITFRDVTKRFGKVVAVDNVNLDIEEGEFFALLGPSGCGKTTLLRMLAGFETPTEGRILIDGKDMARLPPNKRPVNMVFQSYAVFPHMKVADNVAYGLKMDGVPQAERDKRVRRGARAGASSAAWPRACPISFPAASVSAWRWRARW